MFTQPTRTASAEERKHEQLLVREERTETAAIDHALGDLKHSQAAETKAEKSVDKAVHAHEKTVATEYKTAKALNKAEAAHNDAGSAEKFAAQTVEIKQQHQHTLEQNVAQKKAELEQFQQKKATNDSVRDAMRNPVDSAPPASPAAPAAVAPAAPAALATASGMTA